MEQLNKDYLDPYDVINIICEYFNVEKQQILSRSRKGYLIYPRMFIFYFLRMLDYRYDKIGEILNRDHSTVLYGVNKLEYYLTSDKIVNDTKRIKNDFNSINELLLSCQNRIISKPISIVVQDVDLVKIAIYNTKSFVN